MKFLEDKEESGKRNKSMKFSKVPCIACQVYIFMANGKTPSANIYEPKKKTVVARKCAAWRSIIHTANRKGGESLYSIMLRGALMELTLDPADKMIRF